MALPKCKLHEHRSFACLVPHLHCWMNGWINNRIADLVSNDKSRYRGSKKCLNPELYYGPVEAGTYSSRWLVLDLQVVIFPPRRERTRKVHLPGSCPFWSRAILGIARASQGPQWGDFREVEILIEFSLQETCFSGIWVFWVFGSNFSSSFLPSLSGHLWPAHLLSGVW